MTLLIAFVAAVVPAFVTFLTNLLKKLPTYTSLSDAARTPAVRFLAALISLVVVLITEWMAGAFDSGIISVSIQTVFFAFATWVASMGIFHSTKPAVPST